jgi:hypothetical protein
MVYIPAEESGDGFAKVVYTSKDRKFQKVFDALDWLARLVTHIPGRYEQTVRYCGLCKALHNPQYHTISAATEFPSYFRIDNWCEKIQSRGDSYSFVFWSSHLLC